MTPQKRYIEEAERNQAETEIAFRTAFKQRSGKLSHVIMPADLRNQAQQSLQAH